MTVPTGWARNLSGDYKMLRDKLILLTNELEFKAETTLLTNAEQAAKREADDKLSQLRRDEESKWAPGAKVKYIQEGGSNTRYFRIIANGKHREKKTLQLEQVEGTIVGQKI